MEKEIVPDFTVFFPFKTIWLLKYEADDSASNSLSHIRAILVAKEKVKIPTKISQTNSI